MENATQNPYIAPMLSGTVEQTTLRIICNHFGKTPEELAGRRRFEKDVVARQLYAYILKLQTKKTLTEIGSIVFGYDHSTICHALKRIQCMLETNDKYSELIFNVLKEIGYMKSRITLTGEIQDGQAAFVETMPYKTFCSQNDGYAVVITIEILDHDPTKAQVNYFLKVIVPEFQRLFYEKYGERYTLEKTRDEILKMAPSTIRTKVVGSKYKSTHIPFDELTSEQLSDAIDHLKHIAAEHFDTYIK